MCQPCVACRCRRRLDKEWKIHKHDLGVAVVTQTGRNAIHQKRSCHELGIQQNRLKPIWQIEWKILNCIYFPEPYCTATFKILRIAPLIIPTLFFADSALINRWCQLHQQHFANYCARNAPPPRHVVHGRRIPFFSSCLIAVVLCK